MWNTEKDFVILKCLYVSFQGSSTSALNSSSISNVSVVDTSSLTFNTTTESVVTSVSLLSNVTDPVSLGGPTSWTESITQDTYFIVYAGSLAGIIMLQLAKGFAGAKVLFLL